MSSPGPAPKPVELKILEGTARPEDLRRNEPRPQPVAPTMPRGVLPKRARKLWRELAPKLERVGILTEVDGPAFALL